MFEALKSMADISTVDGAGAAALFPLARGRGGENIAEDRAALTALLRLFAMHGYALGLQRAKEEFRTSSDSRGGCRMLSQGEDCNCTLCRIDNVLTSLK